jgi:hypothetical protein
MSEFLTNLDIQLIDEETTWQLGSPLVYLCDLLPSRVTVPAGFKTDLASVPRLPIIYGLWGDRAHREAVLHDYLYRDGASPPVTFEMANQIFFEAMTSRGVSAWIRYPMYWAVSMFGRQFFRKEKL